MDYFLYLTAFVDALTATIVTISSRISGLERPVVIGTLTGMAAASIMELIRRTCCSFYMENLTAILPFSIRPQDTVSRNCNYIQSQERAKYLGQFLLTSVSASTSASFLSAYLDAATAPGPMAAGILGGTVTGVLASCCFSQIFARNEAPYEEINERGSQELRPR